ncbi:MAG: MFS transporter [Nitrososphaerota archaeon]|nr:MFS transporter [Candidatus Calditenuis fumarioli]
MRRGDSGLRAVLLIGLVSLLGDAVYEGGRSVVPDLFRSMGVTAAGVGAIVGLAELGGWLSRPLGGLLTERVRRADLIVRAGYAALLVVPLMALAPGWEVLAVLVFAERIARGLRIPPRDVMLARLRGQVGSGTAFGVHELLDQIGAAGGPLIIALGLTLHPGDVRTALLYSLLPYAALLLALTRLPSYRVESVEGAGAGGDRGIHLYVLAASLNVAGLIPVQLVLYRISQVAGEGSWLIPAAYTLAMVTDAAAAPLLGRLYDRYGPSTVGLAMALSVVPPLLVTFSIGDLLLASALVGVVIGAQESIFRAAVAELAGLRRIGSAYGLFGLGIGLGSAAAGLAFGWMMDLNLGREHLFAYSVAVQAASIALLLRSRR